MATSNTGFLYFEPRSRPISSNFGPLPGATLTFFITGTTTLTPIYADAALQNPLPNPVTADGTGTFPAIYLDPGVIYRVQLINNVGVLLEDTDPGASADLSLTILPVYAQTAQELLNNVTPTNLNYLPGDIRRYGALSGTFSGFNNGGQPITSGGNGDCTTAIQNALIGYGTASIPPGDWRLDGQVTINGTTVLLAANSIVTRYSANSTLTSPLFWFQGSNGSIIGQGESSQINTQNRAPSGIVLVGCNSMTSGSPLNQDIIYNSVFAVSLNGQQTYGQLTGNPDACFMQINPQLDGHVAYFTFLEDIVATSANYGYWFQGWANGNLMSNLHGKWIGNTKRIPPATYGQSPVSGGDALFYYQGCIENALAGVFHHYSPGTPSLRIEDYDNRATTNGSLHIASYNQISNFTCEQGDYTSAFVGSTWTAPAVLGLAVVANANCSCFANTITINDNTSGGNDISSVVRYNNEFNLISGPSFSGFTSRRSIQLGNPSGGVLTGTLTSGSNTITNVGPPGVFVNQSTGVVPTDLIVGAVLTGTGIPSSPPTTVTAITPSTTTESGTITMSANATTTSTLATQLINYSVSPGIFYLGNGKLVQFYTPYIAQGTATTLIGNVTSAMLNSGIIIGQGVLVMCRIANLDINSNASRTDLLLLNVTSSSFVASTVTVVSSSYTSSSSAEDPATVSYTLTSGATPALQVSVSPTSGTGHTYTAVCNFISTM